jgi:hypothetical protein
MYTGPESGAVPVVKDNFTVKQGLEKVLTTEELQTHCKDTIPKILNKYSQK